MTLCTERGELPAEIRDDRVRLTLPAPRDGGNMRLDCGDERLEGRYVLAGAPHFVVWSESIFAAPLRRWGPAVRHHASFGSEGANLTLAMLRADGVLAIRTWERGVEGETLACGSGAVAAAHVARTRGANESLTVLPASGVPLGVSLSGAQGEAREAVLEGDARFIFEGVAGEEATRGFPDS